MNFCIQYARPTSGSGDSEIFGLDVAVSNFLSAWFRYGGQDKFLCRPADMPSLDHFRALAAAEGVDPDTRCFGLDPRTPRQNLQSINCIFRPDPLVGELMWRRQQLEGPGFAVCGLVHTMSGERIARAVTNLMLAPSDSSDALICPSVAIRDAVQKLWEIYAEYINHRFGGKFVSPIATPVIPLGVETQKFERLTTSDKRASQRAALNAAEDEVIILFMGRLSFATKAHPLPLLLAAEKLAKRTQKRVRLVMYGYFKPKDMEKHYRDLVAAHSKLMPVEFIMNNDARFPDGLWAGADIFVSLADNIQESFGLTPIEAMACGLPTIVTDWDGYRGGVRDGVDGYCIPTAAPPASAGMAIAEAYFNNENYGVSLMGAAQSTSLDIDRTADALLSLVEDNAKRRTFGASGKRRAAEAYDWKHVIKDYKSLWSSLADKRQSSSSRRLLPTNWQAVHPAFPNPWEMFKGFPTRILAPEDRLSIVLSNEEISQILNHEMNYFLPEFLIPKDSLLKIAEAVRSTGSPRISDILLAFQPAEHPAIWRCIGWMLKHGIAAIG